MLRARPPRRARAPAAPSARRNERLLLHRPRRRRRRANGRDHDAARRHSHAGVHAGGHRRHGQGDVSGGGARARRRYRAVQHLSSDAGARGRTDRQARRPAQIHELAVPDPHRFRRLPGDEPIEAAQARRARRRLPIAHRRLAARIDAGKSDGDSGLCSAPTFRCSSTNACACRARARRPSAPCACRCAGPSVRRRPSPPRRAGRCSASCRGARKRTCARRARANWSRIGFDGYAIGGLAVGEPQADDARNDRGRRAASAGRPAALSHGRRHAGRSPGVSVARRRHVRLRDADEGGTARHGLHPPRASQSAQRAFRRRSQARRSACRRRRRRATIREPIGAISSSQEKSWR